MLAVQAEKQLGEFAVNVSFTSDTAATALFGPSGAGKTSVINMIAGLLKPERGRIVLGDDVLFDSTTGINVPTWRRRIGYVFQEGRLFPHFSVKRNLDYGRWVSGHASDPRQLSHVIDLLNRSFAGPPARQVVGRRAPARRRRPCAPYAAAPAVAGRAPGFARRGPQARHPPLP
jgi:ABC-type molybdate transport system ATPase subunit